MEKIEIKVTKTNISLTNGYVLNQGEYQVDKCKFTFTDDYDGLIKKAVFVDGDTNIDMVILNDECDIPYEILQTSNEFVLKVYGYEVDNEELKLRYSPTALKMFLREGSYVGSNEVITPTQFEQYEQALHDGLEEVANVDIDAVKEGNTATVTITNRDGVEKSVQIFDGEQGEQGVPGPAGQDGKDGADAKINGVNTLTLAAGENITLNQSGDTLTISSQGGSGAVTSVNGQTGDVTIDVPDVSNFITKDVNNLTYYTLATNTGATIELSINSSTYVMTMNLKNSAGTTISTGTVDLPLESVVVNGSYDSTNKKIILTLQSGSTINIPVGDLVSGLQSEITSSNKLSADLIDDTSTTNKLTNATEKTAWSAKYDLPSGGIPSTDLSSAVQTSLGKADTALQSETYTGTITSVKMNGTTIASSGEADLGTVITQHQDISGKLDTSKVKNSTSTTSGDVYDVTYINTTIGNIETLLSAI
jgi:hypothetical protein